MDELSAAIEAAAAATSQSPPKSPEIKMEIKHEHSSPVAAPPSLMKRARSPFDDTKRSDEKRQRTDDDIPTSDPEPNASEVRVEPSQQLLPAPDLQPSESIQSTKEVQPLVKSHTGTDPEPASDQEPLLSLKSAEGCQAVLETIPAAEPQQAAETQPEDDLHPASELGPAPRPQSVPELPLAADTNQKSEVDQVPVLEEDHAADIAALLAAHEADQMPDVAHSMADLDEITRMIQAAQEAALGTDHVPEDHPMPDFHADLGGTQLDHEHDLELGRLMASITSGLEHSVHGHDQENLHHDINNDTLPTPDVSPAAPVAAKRPTIWSNRAQYTRQTHILPTLGKVAVDILVSLSDQLLEETITAINDPDNGIGQEYGLLRSFFDTMRKQFSEDFPLLYPDQLAITSPEDREIIRIANLATSCASMFGANELGWPDLNASFLSTFVADGIEMASEEANLYLGLKTQMFLTLLESEQPKSKSQILEELFISGQEDALKRHHPGLPLASSETTFLADAEARKAMLLKESLDAASIQTLSHKYTYEAFLEELGGYLEHNMANIEQLGSSPTSVSADAETAGLFDGVEGLDSFDIDAAIAEAAKAAQEAVGLDGASGAVPDDLAALISFASEQAQGQPGSTNMPSNILSTSESAMRATNLALQTMQQNQYHPTTVQPTNTTSPVNQHVSHPPQQPSQQQPQQPQQQQYYAYPQQPTGVAQQSQNSDRVELPPGQHASSEILYERARQAAAARSSTHARREGSHSTRRPWSPEEEKALMMGLDMVKGPHWSQILSLFGPQGRMSNILADRTQVQLKDKARNLKLFFLKTNSEMPYYLQCVTGELKTRAPTQAARKEAEERARLTSEDDKSHVSATMALGNMHNGHTQRPQPKPAAPKSATPGQTISQSHSHPGSPHISQSQRTASGHAGVPISAQPATNGQHAHLAQAGQKSIVPAQPQQHNQQVQQVAPRPSQQAQNHVPLKPLQQHPHVQQHQVSQTNGLQHQTLQNQQRQVPNQQQQSQIAPQQQQQQQQQQPKQIQPQPQSQHQQQQKPQLQPQPQPQPQPQVQHHHQQQHQQTHPEAQMQPQIQPPLQRQPQLQGQSQNQSLHTKAEEPPVKHESLNEEEAGLLQLKRFMSQDNSVNSQEQSIEAALAAASAAAAAVAAGPS